MPARIFSRKAFTKQGMTNEKIIKFLNNRCSDAEIDEIIRWANSEAFSEESIKWGLSDWKLYREETNACDDEKFSSIFDKIHEKIRIESRKQDKRKAGKSLFLTWLTRSAAILLFPTLAFLFYTLAETADIKTEQVQVTYLPVDSLEIIAPIGSRTVVQLSDGSEVHLNFGSRLKYPQAFTGNTRGVLLTGEGFFNVAHNPEKPFIVKTGKLNVRALGTAFNVLAYPGDNKVETTLVNGKVVLERDGTAGITKTIDTLEPGQHVSYYVNTGNVKSSKGNIEKFIGWKEGKLIFDETTIVEAAELLSRMYNVQINVKDNIKDFTYTVTFEDEPLFQILDLMTVATPVRYEALPRKKLPNGTFSKQEITFKRK